MEMDGQAEEINITKSVPSKKWVLATPSTSIWICKPWSRSPIFPSKENTNIYTIKNHKSKFGTRVKQTNNWASWPDSNCRAAFQVSLHLMSRVWLVDFLRAPSDQTPAGVLQAEENVTRPVNTTSRLAELNWQSRHALLAEEGAHKAAAETTWKAKAFELTLRK